MSIGYAKLLMTIIEAKFAGHLCQLSRLLPRQFHLLYMYCTVFVRSKNVRVFCVRNKTVGTV